MKFIARVESDCVRFNAMKKGSRQMVSVNDMLYRTDDYLHCRDWQSNHAIVFYDVNSTQPIMPRAIFVDPDLTLAYIDSAKEANNRKGIWSNLTPSKITSYLTAIVIVGALVYGFLIGGKI